MREIVVLFSRFPFSPLERFPIRSRNFPFFPTELGILPKLLVSLQSVGKNPPQGAPPFYLFPPYSLLARPRVSGEGFFSVAISEPFFPSLPPVFLMSLSFVPSMWFPLTSSHSSFSPPFGNQPFQARSFFQSPDPQHDRLFHARPKS